MRMTTLAGVAGLYLLLGSGCANVEEQRSALAAQPSCCSSLGALPASDLPPEGARFMIGDQAPVFQFSQGKSRFQAAACTRGGA